MQVWAGSKSFCLFLFFLWFVHCKSWAKTPQGHKQESILLTNSKYLNVLKTLFIIVIDFTCWCYNFVWWKVTAINLGAVSVDFRSLLEFSFPLYLCYCILTFLLCGYWYSRDGAVKCTLLCRGRTQPTSVSFASGTGSILLPFLQVHCLKSHSCHPKGNISLENVTPQFHQL